jgi:hypothetical protein
MRIAPAALLLLALASPAAADSEPPRWIDNPQAMADEDEVAFVGQATSPSDADAARKQANDDARRQGTDAAVSLLQEALPAIRSELGDAGAALDGDKLEAAVRKAAQDTLARAPIEKWFAAIETVTEDDEETQSVRAWVYLQFPKMDLARWVIDSVERAIGKRGGAEPKALRVKIRAAVATVTKALPPN